MNPWRGLKNLPREVWILFVATLVNRVGTMALPFLVLYLTRTLGVPPARAALALTIYGAAALITVAIAGRLSDRLGPVAVMRASLLLSGIFLLLFPLAHSYRAILGMTFFFAIANEAVRPPTLAIISDAVAAEQRKAAFALTRLAVNLGMSVGPVLGGFLAVYSFHLLFLVDGGTSLLAAVFVMLAPWPVARPSKTHDVRWEGPEDLGREIEAEGVAPLATVHPAADLRAFRNRRMLYFLAAFIPAQLVFFQLSSTLPLFLVRTLGLHESVYGMTFTLNTLMIVALEVPLNSAMAHWSHRRSLTLGAILYAIGFGSFAVVARAWGVAAATIVWTFGEMILLPASAAYAAEIAPAGRRGEYMGLYAMSFSMAFSLGPWMGAEILQRWGAHALWGTAFASGCVSAFLMSRIWPGGDSSSTERVSVE